MSDANPSGRPLQRQALARLCNPGTIAFVGVSETSPWARTAIQTMAGGNDVVFVHPKGGEVFGGHKAYQSLAEVDRPVDSVFSVVSAARTLDVVRQAAEIGAAGVVTIAGGFAEMGAEGAALQQEMAAFCHANGLSVIGPNGIGMINMHRTVTLSMMPIPEIRAGGLSAVMHSGSMIGAMVAAGYRPGGVGLNMLISAGNEAVTDVADYLDFLVDDENTRIIALGLEKIRRPRAFFDAAARALEAGKPIIAIKMGRGARGAKIAASHTGTLTGDSWAYEVAFRQAGIQIAHELDELVDRVQFLEQLPRSKWTQVKGLAVLTATGGFSQLASDIGEDMGLDIPDLEDMQPWVAENIPGGNVPNPLDSTGFIISMEGLWDRILDAYGQNGNVDTLFYLNPHAEWDQAMAPAVKTAIRYAEVAEQSDKPFIMGTLAGTPGTWLEPLREKGVAIGNGLVGTFRGLQTMGNVMRVRADARVFDPASVPAIARPVAQPITVAEGQMLPFRETMELLSGNGIAVAPYAIVEPGETTADPAFDGPYVVKLADVAHRTEHGAVKVGVAREDIPQAIRQMREIADGHGLPATVAIQAMLKGHGEAFVGIQTASELGPVVAFGLGGIFVEVLKKIGGRMAPFDQITAAELIAEFDSTGLLDGFRGAAAWDRAKLGQLLVACSRLAAGGRDWIDTIDINPLIVTENGPVAVDGLCLIR